MIFKTSLRDFRWILPTGLVLGIGLSLLDGNGLGWIGAFAYTFLLVLSFYLLTVAWRWAGAFQSLGWVLVLAFSLRLMVGIALTFLLPATGYDSPVYQAGYSYEDAYRRDLQAWELAGSGQPITVIFNKEYAAVDQYGGLMALSALLYRFISPDAHRPWLVIILSAGIYALGAAFLWRAARQVWGEGVTRTAVWLYGLYPETLLLGSSQMREPFLIAFIAMAFWGVVDWQSNRHRLGWVGIGLAGMLAFSPGVALAILVVLAGWFWLDKRERKVSWKVLLAVGIIFLVALVLFSMAVGRAESVTSDSLIGKILQWFRYSAAWDIYELARTSPRVDPIFKELPETLHIPFVAVYGLLQPVLPAALVEPAPWLVMTISILRGIGWYGLFPLLAYGLVAAIQTSDVRQRRLWLWLALATITWLVISAIRAGGDQWDNPRYRAIFLIWQVLLAGYALFFRKERGDPWLWRFLAVEVVFLAFFTEWYIARYSGGAIGKLYFWDMAAWISGLGVLILAGGWLWDLWRKRKNGD
jgi:hypothetical protein